MAKQFDVIVIGAGPGGYTAALKATEFGPVSYTHLLMGINVLYFSLRFSVTPLQLRYCVGVILKYWWKALEKFFGLSYPCLLYTSSGKCLLHTGKKRRDMICG